MAPSLTVSFEQKDDNKLEVTILSCEDLSDLDGWQNVTDAYVTVKIGSKKKRTKPVGGSLDPKFNKETSTFLFDVSSQIKMTARGTMVCSDMCNSWCKFTKSFLVCKIHFEVLKHVLHTVGHLIKFIT